MAFCPFCDAEVIEGDDDCPECHASLADLHLPEPATSVERALLTDRVGELKPNRPRTIRGATPIGEVLLWMQKQQIGCALVMDDEGKLAGIFSERDALMRIGANVEQHWAEPVSKFMTSDPRTLVQTAKVAFAVHRMDVGGFRHLPIVDETGSPVGVVSVRDILSYLASLTD